MSFRSSEVVVIGHRGGRGEGWPAENTIASFERARSEGVLAIELDVRTCESGEVVVFHDVDLGRMTRGEDARLVAHASWTALANVKLGGTGESMPLLIDVLAWAAERGVAVNVELKHDVPSRHTLARGVARALRGSRTDVLLSSFDPVLLFAMAALAPKRPRALLTNTRQGIGAAVLRELARPSSLFAIHVERTQTDGEAIARYRRRGLRVGVWTVNDPSEAVDLVHLGVDFVITDSPGVVASAIAVALSAPGRRKPPARSGNQAPQAG